MAKRTQPNSVRAPASRAPAQPTAEVAHANTRIDPPHVIAGSEAATDQGPSASIANLDPALSGPVDPPPDALLAPLALGDLAWEQMQNQASEIAAQLAKQQATLDHREAELNARAAAVESQVRAARLWLTEKLEMLAHHKGDLSWTQRADAAGQAGAGPIGSRGQASSDDRLAPLAHVAQIWKHELWQEQFEQWRSDDAQAPPADQATDVSPRPPTENTQPAQSRQDQAEVVERRLAARAAELEARRAELVADRQALEAEREAFFVQRQEERWRLAELRRTTSEKLMRQRARLRRRREDFDARETALRQLRTELLRSQQQTLELRLAAEELWARQRGKASTARTATAKSHLKGWSEDDLLGTA